jgi:hypothetical protein
MIDEAGVPVCQRHDDTARNHATALIGGQEREIIGRIASRQILRSRFRTGSSCNTLHLLRESRRTDKQQEPERERLNPPHRAIPHYSVVIDGLNNKGKNILDSAGGTGLPWPAGVLFALAELIDRFGARAGHAVGALRDASWQLTALEKTGLPRSTPVPNDVLMQVIRLLGTVQKFCEDLQLDSPLDELCRIRAAVTKADTEPVTIEYMGSWVFDVTKRLQDELYRRKFYYLDPEHAAYFCEAHQILSEGALKCFPDTSRDVEEAAKSFALGRNTACVFHLMRVMEHGMNALAKELGVVHEYKTWEKKIEKMATALTDELRKPYAPTSPLAGRMEFFKQATERLTAVQHALRNETMHARSHYGQDDARDIYRSVLRFMEQLAGHLAQPSA